MTQSGRALSLGWSRMILGLFAALVALPSWLASMVRRRRK